MSNESNTTSTDEVPHPDPHYMSEETYSILLRRYLALPNIGPGGHEKRSMLKLMGLENRQIEELCKPMEYTREQCMRDVKELDRKERKKLRKMDKERKRLEEHAAFIQELKKLHPG